MEASEKKIPNFNNESERLNKLLAEHAELLKKRKERLAEVHTTVMLRWRNEDDARPELATSNTEDAINEKESTPNRSENGCPPRAQP